MTEQEAKEILCLSDEMKKRLPNLKDVYEVAVNALSEVHKYRALGTVEELQEAREKQMPMKPKSSDPYNWKCPKCGAYHSTSGKYCSNCGQAIVCIGCSDIRK